MIPLVAILSYLGPNLLAYQQPKRVLAVVALWLPAWILETEKRSSWLAKNGIGIATQGEVVADMAVADMVEVGVEADIVAVVAAGSARTVERLEGEEPSVQTAVLDCSS
jgi:hypothetical protein